MYNLLKTKVTVHEFFSKSEEFRGIHLEVREILLLDESFKTTLF